MNLNELRGLKFKHLFISGLCDGDLPTRYSPEIFDTLSFIKNEAKHLTEERYHFYQTLQAWDEQLYLTYPLADNKKELVESNFLKAFKQLFETASIEESSFLNKIYSKEELLSAVKNLERNELMNAGIDLNKIEEAAAIEEKRFLNEEAGFEFGGYIGGELSDGAMEKLTGLLQKEYSITQLENYAKCPYKYFAERVLNLDPPAEPQEEIEALEMGSLLHNILFEFYTELKNKKIILFNCSEEDFNKAAALLFKTAGSKISQADFTSPFSFFEKEKIFGINGNEKNSLLYKFLEAERDQKNGFTPGYFEVGFGGNEEDVKISSGEFLLRGKIDRIDLNEADKTFKVIDYKLGGKKPSKSQLDEGLSLQLPLYLFAAKQIITSELDEDYSPLEMEIYSLKLSKEFGANPVKLSRKKLSHDEKIAYHNELINETLKMINNYIKDIGSGKFGLSRIKNKENLVCRYCNFNLICRVER
jgi:ATP-dependent helicase/nuclease subunit B